MAYPFYHAAWDHYAAAVEISGGQNHNNKCSLTQSGVFLYLFASLYPMLNLLHLNQVARLQNNWYFSFTNVPPHRNMDLGQGEGQK